MNRIFFIIFFFFISTSSFSEESIYFVDIDKVLNETSYGNKIVQKLKNINSNNLKKIENDEKELKKIEEEINRVKNIISEEEFKKKIDNLKMKIVDYREKKNNTFREYNNLKNKELENFFTKITPLLEEFMEKNSIKIILEKKNILMAKENYDKTNDLVNFINKKIKYD